MLNPDFELELKIVHLYLGIGTGQPRTKGDTARIMKKSDITVRDILERYNVPYHTKRKKLKLSEPITDEAVEMYNFLHFGREYG